MLKLFRHRCRGCLCLLGSLTSLTALAAPPPIAIPAQSDQSDAPAGSGFLDGLARTSQLLGDLGGVRSALSRRGLTLAIQETSEYLGNLSGGTRTGFEYDGLTQIVLQLNTQRAFGYHGGLLNASALQLHGRNLSADKLQSLQTASGIEADDSTRLWELWYSQKFLEEDRLDLKVGQQSLDQEFMVSSNAQDFVNTMLGWPMLPSADLPGGGPAYPLSALGMRASWRPLDGIHLLTGVFSGAPATHVDVDAQADNPHGIAFPTGKGALLIAEAQFIYPALGNLVSPDEVVPLGWTYRIGAWYDTRQFSDQRFGLDGLSLADPASVGSPLQHRGDYAVYAVADRLLWISRTDPNRTLSGFARVMTAPQTDRNEIDYSFNAGLLMHCPLPYRTVDTVGVAVGYAHVSRRAASLDRDVAAFSGLTNPVRSGESMVELTYQYQVTPWLQAQPDIQYIFRPGAGVLDASQPGQRIPDELVIGVRLDVQL